RCSGCRRYRIAAPSRPARRARRAASSAERGLDALARAFVEVQARLRAPPKHVLRAACPFALDEIAQLALGQAGAKMLSEPPVAQHLDRARAVTPENALQNFRRQIAMPGKEFPARIFAVLELAPRQRSFPGPRAPQARKVRRKLLQGVLGEPAVSGDFAAEHRQHRSLAGPRIEAQGVVARDGGRIARSIVVERPHAGVAP